jgi:hypothetical protein
MCGKQAADLNLDLTDRYGFLCHGSPPLPTV